MSFPQLSDTQLSDLDSFLQGYFASDNAATGSKVDANANIAQKTVVTGTAEMLKPFQLQVQRYRVKQQLRKIFPDQPHLAEQYQTDLNSHLLYKHDETHALLPYCASLSLYPMLIDGLCGLGGPSDAPKHIHSFCGTFVNLMLLASSQFAGAIATVEWLMYMDYYLRKDYGADYLNTHTWETAQHFQAVVYMMNQPATARGGQSIFWNISIYDQYYFTQLFGDFVFPDGSKPDYPSIAQLQDWFLTWQRQERQKKVLTFPVVTASMLVDDQAPQDEAFARMCAAQMAQGSAFFVYESDSVDSLSSCCRLRNQLDAQEFSHSLGAGGVSTGSLGVITLNFNRFVQTHPQDALEDALRNTIRRMHAYLIAFRRHIEELIQQGALSIYTGGFIHIHKQFLTIGINGLLEAAEFLGYTASNNADYIAWIARQLAIIKEENQLATQRTGYKFNTECVPAENLGVKNATWDKQDGLWVPRDCYNSYFYPQEADHINLVDKFILHGKAIIQYCDGGSANHVNLAEYPSAEAYYKLIVLAAKTGCNFWCTNIYVTYCEDCEHIDLRTQTQCPKCGSTQVVYATRVIGYLRLMKDWSDARQKEGRLRYKHTEAVVSV